MKAALVIVYMLLGWNALIAQRAQFWPTIRALDQSFAIERPDKAVVKTLVRSADGQPAYLFVCRTGDDETVPNVVYAGDLDCRLIPADHGEVEENLLLEAPNLAAWYSRGRMFATELEGGCARYPEYGRVRHFRLRGMRLTMTFDDVIFAAPKDDGTLRLASYTLHLHVVPDATARRSIAELSGYLDPSRKVPNDPRSCAVVRRGKEW